ncbi:hypothetical protein HK104_008050, partial [Borealophlyctis nickersoniae]
HLILGPHHISATSTASLLRLLPDLDSLTFYLTRTMFATHLSVLSTDPRPIRYLKLHLVGPDNAWPTQCFASYTEHLLTTIPSLPTTLTRLDINGPHCVRPGFQLDRIAGCVGANLTTLMFKGRVARWGLEGFTALVRLCLWVPDVSGQVMTQLLASVPNKKAVRTLVVVRPGLLWAPPTYLAASEFYDVVAEFEGLERVMVQVSPWESSAAGDMPESVGTPTIHPSLIPALANLHSLHALGAFPAPSDATLHSIASHCKSLKLVGTANVMVGRGQTGRRAGAAGIRRLGGRGGDVTVVDFQAVECMAEWMIGCGK